MRKKLLTAAAIATLTIPLAFPANSASASGLVASNTSFEAENPELSDMFETNMSDDDMAAAVEKALQDVEDPVSDPKGFEDAISREVNGPTTGTAFRVVPAVVIAARIGMCAASAYPSISALDPDSGYAHNAGLIGNIVASCIGGGAAGPAVAKWITNHPRTFGAILNGIGLGHLAADSTPA